MQAVLGCVRRNFLIPRRTGRSSTMNRKLAAASTTNELATRLCTSFGSSIAGQRIVALARRERTSRSCEVALKKSDGMIQDHGQADSFEISRPVAATSQSGMMSIRYEIYRGLDDSKNPPSDADGNYVDFFSQVNE